MNIPAKIYGESNKLKIELPLTNPTGKIRVKRREEISNYGLPVATRREPFEENDYVEWQISYATDNPPEETKISGIRLDHQVGFELTKLLCEGIKLGIILKIDVQEMKDFINSVRQNDTLEENEKILREDDDQEVKGGFQKICGKGTFIYKR